MVSLSISLISGEQIIGKNFKQQIRNDIKKAKVIE